MKKIVLAFAALLLAAPAFADSGGALADSTIDPYWPKPNSGASRSLTEDNNPSGAGRTLADSSVDPYWPKPNSGASRTLADSTIDPYWPKPNSGASRSITEDNNPSGAGRAQG